MTHTAAPTRPPDPVVEALRAAGWAVSGPQMCNGRIAYRGQLIASIYAVRGAYEADIRHGAALLGRGIDAEPKVALAIAAEAAKTSLVADLATLYAP